MSPFIDCVDFHNVRKLLGAFVGLTSVLSISSLWSVCPSLCQYSVNIQGTGKRYLAFPVLFLLPRIVNNSSSSAFPRLWFRVILLRATKPAEILIALNLNANGERN